MKNVRCEQHSWPKIFQNIRKLLSFVGVGSRRVLKIVRKPSTWALPKHLNTVDPSPSLAWAQDATGAWRQEISECKTQEIVLSR